MRWRSGAKLRAAMVGATVLLAGAAPAWADAPPGATLTLVPANETKIMLMTPAPAPPVRTASPAAPAVPAAPSSVAPGSPALRALVEASDAERRRLLAEIAAMEGRIATMDDALATAQSGVTGQQAGLEALALTVGRARSDADAAAVRVAQLQAAASAAAGAVTVGRTPVARPPTPGHTPQDAAAQAGQALADAVKAQTEAVRALAGLEQELEVARQSAGGALTDLAARADEAQQARDALAGLRAQLAATEAAAPVAPAATGAVTLVPAPTTLAAATVPAAYLSLYGRAAATCPGLPWTVLAAVGAVESGHGQSTAPGVQAGTNIAGAMGPMQFLAGTWAGYGVDGDGDGVRNVYDPDDAVFGAARYLCAGGAGTITTLRQALWNYNHADWYVELVLDLAARL